MLKQIGVSGVNFTLLDHNPEKSANALDNDNQPAADGDEVKTASAPQQQPRTLYHAKSQNARLLRQQRLNSPTSATQTVSLVANIDQSHRAALGEDKAIALC